MTVLVTGGAGYVGSHVVAELLAGGRRVVVLDDFSNADPGVIDRIAGLGHGRPQLVTGDIRDLAALDAAFAGGGVEAVVHLAGLKAVGESVADPLAYYAVNVGGAVELFKAMRRHDASRLVFSSSATVYGVPERNPIREDAALSATSPYGRTKLFIEAVIADLAAADPEVAAVSLRYFNPVGAHKSGLIGENPKGVPNNLFPFIAQTASGLRPRLRVFGDDYPTPDGTGVRDYIHVVDLARGHLAALDFLMAGEGRGRNLAVNLGCGRGHSVLEAVAAFARAAGRDIPYEIVGRRPGDVAECVADPTRAAELLGWRTSRGLDEMCADHWAFQSRTLVG
jgi:UDP-glucose 4-epimerase